MTGVSQTKGEHEREGERENLCAEMSTKVAETGQPEKRVRWAREANSGDSGSLQIVCGTGNGGLVNS